MTLTLKKIAVAESQQMGALLIGVEKATYLTNRCKIYEILYLHGKRSGQVVTGLGPAETNPEPAMKNLESAVTHLESALVTMYAAILRFLSTASRIYDKSFGARAIHSILNPEEVVNFVDECRGLETRVDIEAGNCERTYSRAAHAELGECGERLKQLLAGLQEPIMRVDSRVAALQDRLDESERLEILTWVSDIPYESNHYTARKERTDGTGEWLLRHERYREWRGSSASTILWLHGIRRCCPAYILSTCDSY
jgi:ankyrin repeat domain-containing protein 50